MLRRLAFIRAAANVGLTLDEIRDELDRLPDGRTPTRADWQRITRHWRGRLDEQIAALERLRDGLDSCIGCGCLSLKRCAISNPRDIAAGSTTHPGRSTSRRRCADSTGCSARCVGRPGRTAESVDAVVGRLVGLLVGRGHRAAGCLVALQIAARALGLRVAATSDQNRAEWVGSTRCTSSCTRT